jgi:O-antigen ligase/tetratricopeptide (TPR) repeat protein
VKKNSLSTEKTAATKKTYEAPWYSAAELPAFLLIALYALVDFVPPLEGADVMGAQWLYLSLVHIASGLYLFSMGKSRMQEQLGGLTRSLLSLLLLGFTLMAGLSIFGAINRIESMVVYARLLTTVLMYFQIGLLFCGRLQLLKPLAQFFALLLLIQSLEVISQFYEGINAGTAFDSVISNIKVNTGNKNILAATLAIKISFTLYALWQTSGWLRWLLSVVVVLAISAIVIVNARASFVSVGAQLFLLIVFVAINAVRTKDRTLALQQLAWSLLPVVIGFFMSNWMLTSAMEMQEGPTGYNTVAERAKTITFETSGRSNLWLSAIDYIKKHPVQGAGYGNWKLASIPYEREHIDELFVAYHSHNDFLEMTADTGWLGGALYLSLFVVASVWLLYCLLSLLTPTLFLPALTTTLALASYFTDASFNFPVERPVMQFFLAFVLVLVVQLRLAYKQQIAAALQQPLDATPTTRVQLISYAVAAVAALLFSGYFNAKVFQSMQAQYEINQDMLQADPKLEFEKVNRDLPDIPNLNAFCFPVTLIKSRYLIKAQQYKEALALLHQSRFEAPYLSINEFFTAQCHLQLNNKDSALHWARVAFNYRPRVRNNYVLLNQLLAERKDSAGIEANFRTTSKFRNEPWTWSSYLAALTSAGRLSETRYTALVDSAITFFPQDPDILSRKQNLSSIRSKPFFDAASNAFLQRNYQAALEGFLKTTEVNPYDYANFENVGMCYHALQRYDKAIEFFDKVIAMGTARDAKSYYFKGLCLGLLGQQPAACASMRLAAARNFPGAAEYLKANCP